MAAALLDVLDSNLRLSHNGKVLSSPGYALLEGSGYQFGEAARANARRQPRNINTRFWSQLSTRPLQPALGTARHTADLVHAHLLDLHAGAGSPDQVVLAVPDSLQREQLSLLLGIIGASPFDAVGLVNRSLLLGEKHAGEQSIYHLELQLHQALLTQLVHADGELKIADSQTLPNCGLLSLQDGIVELVATAFINNTRFDPRRQADSEQQLYDGLAGALQALRDGEETAFEINGYRTRMRADDLRGVSDRLFNAAMAEISRSQGEPLILLDPLAALLPGLEARFPRCALADTADMHAVVERHAQRILQRPDELHLIRGLPLGSATPATGEPAATPDANPAPARHGPPPSHIVHSGKAMPLAGERCELADGWRLERVESGWILGGGSGQARLNGEPYHGGVLAIGDELSLGAAGRWLLIEVAG